MNLFKMDFYRIRKSLSTYIVLISLILFFCLDFVMMFGAETSHDAEFSAVTNNFSSYFQYLISGDVIAFFIAIISAIFVYNEISSGSIKNIYGKETHKYKLILSKVLVITIFIFVMYMIAVVASMVANLFHDGTLILGTDLSKLLKFALVQFILGIGFCSIVVCMGSILRNNILTIIISLVYCSYGYMIERFIDGQIQKNNAFKEFTLSNYIIMGNLQSINLESSVGDCIRAVIVAFIITVISIFLGGIFLNKSDVK